MLESWELPPAVSNTVGEQEVVFEAGALGLQLETGFAGQAVVVRKCVKGGQGAALGVRAGSVLVAVHGESVVGIEFPQVMWQLQQAHRPLMLRFREHDIFFRQQRDMGAALEKEDQLVQRLQQIFEGDPGLVLSMGARGT